MRLNSHRFFELKQSAALSENISRGVDIFGDKGMFVSQIYQILHALWIFTTLRSQWIPTEKDCAVMSGLHIAVARTL